VSIYRNLCNGALLFLLLLPPFLCANDYALYYTVNDSLQIGLSGIPYAAYSTDKGASGGLSIILFERNTAQHIKSGQHFRLRLDGEVSTKEERSFSIDTGIPLFNRGHKVSLDLMYKTNQKDFYGLGNTPQNILNHFTKEQYVFKGNWIKLISNNLKAGVAWDVSGYENSAFESPPVALYGNRKLYGFDSYYTTRGVGAVVVYSDKLPNNFPASGNFFQSQFLVYSKEIDSDYDFFTWESEYHYFLPLGEHIIANQIVSKNTFEQTPYHYLTEQGNANLMRGYSTGRFIDKHLFAVQTEYRSPIFFWRISAVGFVSTALTYKSTRDVMVKNIHVTGGGGLRIAVDKAERINLRADVGVSSEGYMVYLKFGEAF